MNNHDLYFKNEKREHYENRQRAKNWYEEIKKKRRLELKELESF